MQRAAGLECRADYFRNLKLIDWRLAPPLRNDFELELREPEPAAFAQLCGYWDLTDVDQAWRGFSIPRKGMHSVVANVRGVLERAGGRGNAA